MIKLDNVSKYFFKGKPNEIKAMQNVSLTLTDGLVMLVGKSGCGKTTLLNVMGGLERPDCGSVTVDGVTIRRYQCEQWDKLRNRTIGYVFQNYNLIDDLTVYQNLELVLKLAGIDEQTYKERIEYALSLVGMEKYVQRHPSSLSGGQQQRVGIARAIVKGAGIIIADEPTGNLDDTNTIAVMELLKGLSKHCLVVVVTHEEDLAEFYADRIIRLQDGCVVSDDENDGEGSIAHRAADHVYLGDMQREDYHHDGLDISVFQEGDIPKAKVKIVCQNGRILLQVEGDSKVTYVTKDSSILLDEGKFAARTKADKDIPVDMNILSAGTGTPKRVFTFRQCFKESFRRFLDKWGVRRKNPYRLLYTVAVFFVIMIALSGTAFLYDRDANVAVDDNVYGVVGVYQQADLPAGMTVMDRFTGSATIVTSFNHYGSDVSIDTQHMMLMPYSAVGGSVAKGEVYLDKLLYDRMVKKYQLDGLVRNESELIGLPIEIVKSDYGYFLPTESNITTDNSVPNQSVGDAEYQDYPMDYEYMEYTSQETLRCTIAGFVNRNSPVIYMSDDDYNSMPKAHFSTEVNYRTKEITLVYGEDSAKVKQFAASKDAKLLSLNKMARNAFYKEAVLRKLVFIILAGVVVIIQIFAMARLARNEYLGKIKLYAQYRSIGVSRAAIYGKISTESAITSLLTSMRGWAIASLVFIILSNMKFMSTLRNIGLDLFYYPVWFALVCGAFLMLLNQVVNLLSPIALLAHTPSKLMTKYDI